MDDEGIIALFFERSEQAITEVSQKYGRLMTKVAIDRAESSFQELSANYYLLISDLNHMPISSLTSLKHLTAKSRSSLVWPAETWVRILSLPLGTTG